MSRFRLLRRVVVALVATGLVTLPPWYQRGRVGRHRRPPVTTTTVPATTLAHTTTTGPTGTGTPGAPYAGAPLCPTHDDTAWHGLWDASRGCHYDHTHNWNPSIVDDVLGPVGRQTISYPWETTHENHHKHGGYKYGLNRDLACVQVGLEYLNAHCVRAFRIQYHDAGILDTSVRQHSYFAEGQICPKDGSRCGVIRTGGWADFGILRSPYNGALVPLPADPADAATHLFEPYRTANPADDLAFFRDPRRSCKACHNGGVGAAGVGTITDNFSYWSTDEAQGTKYGANRRAGFKFWVYDAPDLVDRADPLTPVVICPAYDCRFNSSEHLVYEVVFSVPAELDTDGDARVTYRGYTDRNGSLVAGCTAPGVDCVPFELVDAPVGIAAWTVASNQGYSETSPGGVVGPPDFDVSPADEWWIRPPN